MKTLGKSQWESFFGALTICAKLHYNMCLSVCRVTQHSCHKKTFNSSFVNTTKTSCCAHSLQLKARALSSGTSGRS